MRSALAISLSFATLGVVLGAAVVKAAPPRSGKIVRVERPRLVPKDRIRLCVQTQTQADHLLCIGEPPPASGDELHLLDFNGPYLGTARVTRTTPSTQTGCESKQVSDVYYSTAVADAPTILVGIGGIAMDHKTKVRLDTRDAMPSGARDGENRWLAFDVDGVGELDLLITMRKCTENRPPGTTGQGQCLAFWIRDGSDWRLKNEDAIYNCN